MSDSRTTCVRNEAGPCVRNPIEAERRPLKIVAITVISLYLSFLRASIMATTARDAVRLERAVNSLTVTVAECMKSFPEPPAEALDYRVWTENFIKVVVRVYRYVPFVHCTNNDRRIVFSSFPVIRRLPKLSAI